MFRKLGSPAYQTSSVYHAALVVFYCLNFTLHYNAHVVLQPMAIFTLQYDVALHCVPHGRHLTHFASHRTFNTGLCCNLLCCVHSEQTTFQTDNRNTFNTCCQQIKQLCTLWCVKVVAQSVELCVSLERSRQREIVHNNM